MKKFLGGLVLVAALVVFIGLYAGWWKPKPLVLGVSGNLPPFSLTENGAVTGFDVDLAQSLADSLKRPLQVVPLAFGEWLPALESGQVDLVMGTLQADAALANRVLYSKPYYDATPVALVLEGNPVPESIDELRDRRLSGQVGTPCFTIVQEYTRGRNLHETQSSKKSVVDLLNSQAEIALVDSQPVAALLAKFPEARRTGLSFDRLEYVAAVATNRTELLEDFNETLADLAADGRYEALITRWFVENRTAPPPPAENAP